MSTKKSTATFQHEKSTPGAHKYNEVGPGGRLLRPNDPEAVIGTIYLRKAMVGNEASPRIKVTVEATS